MEKLELLVMAAKAAGIEHVDYEGVDYDGSQGLVIVGEHGQHLHGWDPLTDDGDALRLAVSLDLDIVFYCGFEEVCATNNDGSSEASEDFGSDKLASTRRAIVRAAAEIGRSMS